MAVGIGCTLFALSGRTAARVAAEQPHTSPAGVALMLTYLASDGFTSTWQASRLFLLCPSCKHKEYELFEKSIFHHSEEVDRC